MVGAEATGGPDVTGGAEVTGGADVTGGVDVGVAYEANGELSSGAPEVGAVGGGVTGTACIGGTPG